MRTSQRKVRSTGHASSTYTVDRTEPFSAISSAFLPGMGLSSGMGMVAQEGVARRHDDLLDGRWRPCARSTRSRSSLMS